MNDFIIVTGPDGSGKSTICSAICEQLRVRRAEKTIAAVSIWNALHIMNFSSRDEVMRCMKTLSSNERVTLVFTAMKKALELALVDQPDTVVVDGYWYKYAVSEIGYGADTDTVFDTASTLFAQFTRHPLTFFLHISPSIAFERKKQTSIYERGPNDEHNSESDKQRFIAFQTHLTPIWQLVESNTNPWFHIDAQATVADTVQTVDDVITHAN